MTRWAIILVVLAGAFTICGCGEGMAVSSRERAERHKRIFENDMRQINDDWDLLWLNEDVGHLSHWRTRTWP